MCPNLPDVRFYPTLPYLAGPLKILKENVIITFRLLSCFRRVLVLFADDVHVRRSRKEVRKVPTFLSRQLIIYRGVQLLLDETQGRLCTALKLSRGSEPVLYS